jgi:hypothetical protein
MKRSRRLIRLEIAHWYRCFNEKKDTPTRKVSIRYIRMMVEMNMTIALDSFTV